MLVRTHSTLRSGIKIQRCLYHSKYLPQVPEYTALQTAILGNALKQVPDHGFSDKSLILGARESGYLEITHSIFPKGPFEIARFHLVTSREKLSQSVDELVDIERTDKKLIQLLIKRLELNIPIIDKYHEVETPELI